MIDSLRLFFVFANNLIIRKRRSTGNQLLLFLGHKKLSYRKNLGMINLHCDNFLINAIV